jgi:outer membrane murein-binding lipoprotein Lpp
MTRKNPWISLAAVALLTLPLAACKDTKTLQENEQLKAQAAELQKTNDQLGSNLETVTAQRDELTKQNEALRAQLKPKKSKHKSKPTRKHHRTAQNQNQ